jgi:imidazolonepropionase-like amidohydrolase
VRRTLLLTSALVVVARAQAPQPVGAIAVSHVTVIDGADSVPRRDQTVIIRGTRIAVVGPAARTNVPAGTRVIDGRGRFLVPGFWDMHVHTAVPDGRELLAAYVANGVIGVRDMAGDWATLTAWRHEIAAGVLIGPRIIASGPYIEGGETPIAHIVARTPETARAAVESLKSLGVDFVKVHGRMSRETYLAAVAAAKSNGLDAAGHVPGVVGAADASAAGVKSIEHLLTIPHPCTVAESIALLPRFAMQGALGRCSSTDQRLLIATLVRNGTWVTPTFVAQYEVSVWPNRDVPGDAYARYVPDGLRKFVAEIFPMPDSVPPGADSTGRAVFERRLALAARLYHAGVGVLAGTDAPLRNSPPGFGYHEELALLARGGLTPFEVLRIATYEPARFFGSLDSAGTIAAGRVADVVLLEADPLTDIRNTRRIAAVVANGRLFDAAGLDAILTRLLEAGR